MKKRVISCIVLLSIAIGMCGCHSHEFSEATCTQPKTCISCGETEGEVLPHSFSEATCTQPKTCEICGATEGEALGHSVSIGKCSKCGEDVNFDVIWDISSDYQAANKYWDTANQYINSADTKGSLKNIYVQYSTAYDYILKYQNALSQIINTCDKYPELKKMSSALKDIKNYNIRKPASSSADDLVAFLEDVVELSTLNTIFATEMKNWLNKQ